MQPATAIDKRALLARHFLFSQLKPAELDRILALAVERRFSNGQIIFQKGQEGSSLMMVLRGRVKISICSEDGKEIILNTIEAGNVFGEIALIDGRERSADATAIGACTLLIIRRADFIAFLKENPDIAVQLLTVLCQKVRDTSDIVETVGLLPIPARLARLLFKMAENNGLETPHGMRFKCKLSQREIGNLIGATRESVNKQLRAWQEEGLIKVEQSYITLLQEDELQDIAGSVF
jgi:cAMP-binding proteins - catabolite gene activator and regulatory subunit of cAMP-dependent protein kinases